jgi:hypothetical protein
MGGEAKAVRLAVVAVAVLAVLAPVVTGCGDDEPSSDTADEQAQTAREGTAADGAPTVPPYVRRIEGFGSEATGRQRAEVIEDYDAYAATLADADYPAACAAMKKRVRNVLERYGSKRGLAGCPGSVAQLAPRVRQEAHRRAAGEIESVRVEGAEAYVLFSAPGAALYFASMRRESGEWKAGVVFAPVLVPHS